MPGAADREAIRAVLFDKDGTLFAFRPVWLPAYRAAARAAARAAGRPEAAAALLRTGGWDEAADRFEPHSPLVSGTPAEIARLWAATLGPGAPADLERRLVRTFDRWSARAAAPAADLEALFAALIARGLRLGIASMDSRAALEATLARHAWRRHLAFACGYDSGFGLKPGAGMALAFAQAVGVRPAEVAVVGDSLADLRMARAAGAGLALAVATGVTPRAVLAAEADHVLDDVGALAAWLSPARPRD